MLVRYTVKFKSPVLIDDHWPFPLLGGELRIIETDGLASGMEITFTGQPATIAPKVQRPSDGTTNLNIIERDTLLPQVVSRLRGALAYLQCHFGVDFAINEPETSYEPETDAERDDVEMFGFNLGKAVHHPIITYDFWTRAIMAAETGAPAFEASSVHVARRAMTEGRYIDAFRYAFLLIEAFYGEGKFKSAQLKAAFSSSDELKGFVAYVLKNPMPPKRRHGSPTERLLSSNPSVEAVLAHLVDQRGFYFHGNARRVNAWAPHEQDTAEALCLLALEIAMQISLKGASPMYGDAIAQRHFDTAVQAGAIMTLKVQYTYQELEYVSPHAAILNMRVPGTEVTPRMALYVAQQFLAAFEHETPHAALLQASCVVEDTNQPVFDLNIHVRPGDKKAAVHESPLQTRDPPAPAS